jgi:excisionase family DNA binding protein
MSNTAEVRLVRADDPEVQRLLGASRWVIYRMARERLIPHVRINKQVRFSIPTLRAWIEEGSRANSTASAEQKS